MSPICIGSILAYDVKPDRHASQKYFLFIAALLMNYIMSFFKDSKKKMILLVLLCVVSVFFNQGHCGTVSPTSTTIKTTVGNNAILQWKLKLNGDDDAVGLKLKNGSTDLWASSTGTYTDIAKQIYGDRLVVEVVVGDPRLVTVTVKNTSFTDSGMTFSLSGGFLKGDKYTSFEKNEIKLIVEGGPSPCGTGLNKTYQFHYQSMPEFILCASGNPPPELSFNFNGKNYAGSRILKNWQTHEYEFEMNLPKLLSSDCGKTLMYNITSTLPSSTPIQRKLDIFVTGFPLRVEITSFSYNAQQKPTVIWEKVESGNCPVTYFVEVSNSTGAKVRKGPISTTVLIVDDIEEPVQVTICANNTILQNDSTENCSSFEFTKTTTTKATTTVLRTDSKIVEDENNDSGNLGLIIGGAIGGVLLIILIIIIVVCLKNRKKKDSDSIDHSTNVNVNSNAGRSGKKYPHGEEISLETWQKERSLENNYEPLSKVGAPKNTKEDPSQAIYSELGPGGRVGPKPIPNQSNYAEVKVDDYGYPVTGETQTPPEMTIYDPVKRHSDEFSDNGIIV